MACHLISKNGTTDVPSWFARCAKLLGTHQYTSKKRTEPGKEAGTIKARECGSATTQGIADFGLPAKEFGNGDEP